MRVPGNFDRKRACERGRQPSAATTAKPLARVIQVMAEAEFRPQLNAERRSRVLIGLGLTRRNHQPIIIPPEVIAHRMEVKNSPCQPVYNDPVSEAITDTNTLVISLQPI